MAETGKYVSAGSDGPAPPHDLHAEQAILGSLMLDNSQYGNISTRIKPEDFYIPAHQSIFAAIVSLVNENKAADPITVSNWLKNSGKLDEVGGESFLKTICYETPYAAHVESYAAAVVGDSLLRSLVARSREIIQSVFARDGKPAVDVLGAAQQKIFSINDQHGQRDPLVPVAESADDAIEQIKALMDSKGKNANSIITGYADLDKLTGGLQRSNLVIIAGRPSMGKTALALNIAEYAAIREKKTIAVFSVEMSVMEMTMRMLSSLSSINSMKIREGDLGNTKAERSDNWSSLEHALKLLKDANVYFDGSAAISPAEIATRSAQLHRKRQQETESESGLDLIVVDYLQMLQEETNENNRATELANISRRLKNLAVELNVPVIALSQLNREVEHRTNKRPQLSDMRDSGAIEQDADVVILMYRDEYYNEDSEDYGNAELNIAKHRNGETKTIRLKFMKEFVRFQNFASGDGF